MTTSTSMGITVTESTTGPLFTMVAGARTRSRTVGRRAAVAIALGLLAATGARAGEPVVSKRGFPEPAPSRVVKLSFDQPPPVSGTDDDETGTPETDGPSSGGDLRKGTRIGSVYGSAIFGDQGKGEMYLVHGGVGHFFEDYESVSVEVFGGYVRSGIDDNGGAIGLDVVYRNHFVREEDESRTIYFNAGVGLQQASTNFSGDRHFNFRLRIGFGASFELEPGVRAIVGADYQHISDAGIEGGGGGFDGPMVYAGVTFPF